MKNAMTRSHVTRSPGGFLVNVGAIIIISDDRVTPARAVARPPCSRAQPPSGLGLSGCNACVFRVRGLTRRPVTACAAQATGTAEGC